MDLLHAIGCDFLSPPPPTRVKDPGCPMNTWVGLEPHPCSLFPRASSITGTIPLHTVFQFLLTTNVHELRWHFLGAHYAPSMPRSSHKPKESVRKLQGLSLDAVETFGGIVHRPDSGAKILKGPGSELRPIGTKSRHVLRFIETHSKNISRKWHKNGVWFLSRSAGHLQ